MPSPITVGDHPDWARTSFPTLDIEQRLRLTYERAGGRVVFTSSLGIEDQALTHVIARSGLAIEIVTLDTGRLFPETYAVWAETERRYGMRILAYYPHTGSVETLVANDGIDGFYASLQARKACCNVRKVEPLRRALNGAAVWITGLRAEQSRERSGLAFAEFDTGHGILKVNPLLDWSRAAVEAFVHEHDVPINALHAQGFPSVGCAPCTRAVQPGEQERAGRWWWEQDGAQECGLHVGSDGRLVRTRPVAPA